MEKVQALNCPNCGGPLTIRAFEHTLNVVCPQCLSILDAKDPNLQVLQKVAAKERIQPLIPLGTRGKVRGDVCEVIGFQERTIEVEGMPYSWYEYLLFNPFKGFRYLTEYNGHWNDVKTVRAVPEATRASGKPAMKLLGRTYVHFQRATATTTYVLGEFPWQVRVGETVVADDYIAPPFMLSSETTESETVWSLSEYIPGARVWEMFQLPGSPPEARGIFSNQPSPYAERVKAMWSVCLRLMAALLALAMVVYLFTGEQEVLRRTYGFVPRPGVEASFVTDVFELKGRPSDVEISLRTDVANNWAYFNFALINADTGQAYDFGREVSYYFGRDSDGNWTEGSPGDRVLIPTVPAGRYYLRVEPELAPNSRSMIYELRVRRDVPAPSFFWIAAALLVIPPIIATFRAASFSSLRWQESDYSN